MSIPDPKNLLNLLFTFFSFRNHSEHQQYDLCNTPSWFSRYVVIATIILIFISKRIPLPSCRCGKPRTLHKVHVIIQNIGLQPWSIRFHYFHKLQWIAVITCTSCEFGEAFLFFISHIHINHIQSCVHFGADISTLFCLKLSGKIIGGLFHVLELKHWACSD